MQLFTIFNKNFLEIFQIFGESFPEDTFLVKYKTKLESMLAGEEGNQTSQLHNEFSRHITPKEIDLIYKAQEDVLSNSFFEESNLKKIYVRLTEEEKPMFWKNMQEICRLSSMIRACGKKLSLVEEIAAHVMRDKNYKKDIEDQTLHRKIFENLIHGKDAVANQLVNIIEDPDSFSDMLKNVKGILNPGIQKSTNQKSVNSGDDSKVVDEDSPDSNATAFSELEKLLNTALDGVDVAEISKEMSEELRARQDPSHDKDTDGGSPSATGSAFEMMRMFLQQMDDEKKGRKDDQDVGEQNGLDPDKERPSIGGGFGGLDSVLQGLKKMMLEQQKQQVDTETEETVALPVFTPMSRQETSLE